MAAHLRHPGEGLERPEEIAVDALGDEASVALLDLEEDLLEDLVRPERSARIGESLSAAKTLIDPATDVGNRRLTIPKLASGFGRHAFGDLSLELLAMGDEQLLAFREKTQRLADDLVDRLEAPRRELGSDEILDLVRQRRQVHGPSIPAPDPLDSSSPGWTPPDSGRRPTGRLSGPSSGPERIATSAGRARGGRRVGYR